MLRWFLTGLLLVSGLASGAAAQDLAKNHFKVIGLNSPTPVSIHDEVPFWRKTITEASKGAITADKDELAFERAVQSSTRPGSPATSKRWTDCPINVACE